MEPSKTETQPTQDREKNKWGTAVRVSWELYDYIKEHGNFQESFDDVLKRLLKFK